MESTKPPAEAGIKRVLQLPTDMAASVNPHSCLGHKETVVHLFRLPVEVLVHVLSYLGNIEDLCSVSMVCRTLAEASREDSLWRPLGHPSWQLHHAIAEGGWKGAYMTWLRVVAKQYRHKNASRFVYEEKPGSIYSCTIKIVLIGICGAGKTSLLQRYVMDTFGEYETTIGSTFQQHPCHLSDETVRLQIWDTTGPERFHSLAPMFYRGAHGALCVFDITNRDSFNSLDRFMQELRRNADERCATQMIGCKSDLEAMREVSEEEARTKAEALGVRYAECSAKTGEGVHKAIDELAAYITGGWRCVYGMETPAYVPADALFAARCGRDMGTSALQQPKAEQSGGGGDGYRCSLQ